MTAQRVQCSAAPVWRDRHYVFCSGCCLLTYACHGALPVDVEAGHSGGRQHDPTA
jgi:hypothetical protein